MVPLSPKPDAQDHRSNLADVNRTRPPPLAADELLLGHPNPDI